MPRLPIPNQDTDQWGNVLNEFLRVAHREDGSLRGTIEVVSVKDFGAVGDGKTDDTAAIQAAMTANKTAELKKEPTSPVYFPAGTYLVTGTLEYDHATLYLVGAGIHASVIIHKPSAPNTDLFQFSSPLPDRYIGRNGMQGMTLESANDNSRRLVSLDSQDGFTLSHVHCSRGQEGLFIRYGVDCDVYRCRFRNATVAGIRIASDRTTTTTDFRKCYISSNAVGVIAGATTSVEFHSCIFESNKNFGMRLGSDPGEVNASFKLVGCHFEGNFNGAIRAGDSYYAAVNTTIHSINNGYIGRADQPYYMFQFGAVQMESVGDYIIACTHGFRINMNGFLTRRVHLVTNPFAENTSTTTIPVLDDGGITNSVYGMLGGSIDRLIQPQSTQPGVVNLYEPDVQDATIHDFIPLGGDLHIGIPKGGPIMGQKLQFLFRQGAILTNNNLPKVTWDPIFKHVWADAAPSDINKRSNILFVWDGTNWVQIGPQLLWF